MSEKKYVIIDIHPNDAFCDDATELVGKTINIVDRGINFPIVFDEYWSGHVRLHGILNEEENPILYFYKVQIAPLSEIENK